MPEEAAAAAAGTGAEVEGGAGGPGGASEEKEELEGGAEAGDRTAPALEDPAEELSGGWSTPGLRPPDARSWLNERRSAAAVLSCTHSEFQSHGGNKLMRHVVRRKGHPGVHTGAALASKTADTRYLTGVPSCK